MTMEKRKRPETLKTGRKRENEWAGGLREIENRGKGATKRDVGEKAGG